MNEREAMRLKEVFIKSLRIAKRRHMHIAFKARKKEDIKKVDDEKAIIASLDREISGIKRHSIKKFARDCTKINKHLEDTYPGDFNVGIREHQHWGLLILAVIALGFFLSSIFEIKVVFYIVIILFGLILLLRYKSNQKVAKA